MHPTAQPAQAFGIGLEQQGRVALEVAELSDSNNTQIIAPLTSPLTCGTRASRINPAARWLHVFRQILNELCAV